METAGAVAAMIAAVAGVVGIALQWYWRRPVLELAFTNRHAEANGQLLILNVTNLSDVTARDVLAVGRIGGQKLPRTREGPVNIGPHSSWKFGVRLSRPDQVDRTSGRELLFPSGPVDVEVRVGKRRRITVAWGERKRLGR
jgi:hypothetical protein